MADPNQPLHPEDAATLFLAGEPLLYASDPADPFVYGRYFGQPASIAPLPFDPPGHDQAVLYFTDNPVYQASAYRPPEPGEPVTASIKIKGAGWSVKGTDMSVALTLGQSVSLTDTFLDADGVVAAKPGPVTWTSSDPTQVSVLALTDDTQAVANAIADGSAAVSASSGSLTATIQISVGAGPAVASTISAGPPFPTPVVNPLKK